MKKSISPARAAILGVKTASIASRKQPATRRADGSIKTREERAAASKTAKTAKPAAIAKPAKIAKAKKTARKDLAAKRAAQLAPSPVLDPVVLAELAERARLFREYHRPAAVLAAPPAAEPVVEDEGEQLEPGQTVELPMKLLVAALTVAARDDTRPAINGVYVHQVDGALRMVATDGHRIFVCSFETETEIAWARDGGAILPAELLARIVRYVGRGADSIAVEFGRNHPQVTVREIGGPGAFTFAPIASTYPQYQRIVDASAAVFTADREVLAQTTLNAKYIKSATAVAAALGSQHIVPFLSNDDSLPSVFAFSDAPEALLYIMGARSREQALPAATVKLYSGDAMRGTLAKLEEAIATSKRNIANAKHEKFREMSRARVERLEARAAELRAALAVKLEGPRAAPPAAEPAAEPKATRPTLTVVH